MPTLVIIDIQKEYTTPNRPFYLKGIEPSLKNAQTLLAMARSQHNWQIAHVQHLRPEENAVIFNRYEPHIKRHQTKNNAG